jgi:hypothetical protein
VDAIGRRAERALLIQIGAALEARDALLKTAQNVSHPDRLTRELDRFERRGARAVGRRRREVEREAARARREVKRQTGELKSDAEDVVGRVQRLA